MLVVWLWGAAITVQGDVLCPSPHEVTSALESLLSPGDRASIDARVEIIAEGPSLRLRFLRWDGVLLWEKLLDAEPSCPAMAESVAVVLAAWLARLQTDTPYAFETPARMSKQTDRLRQAPDAPPQRSVSSRRPWVGTVGLGALASFQPATFAPAIALDIRIRPTASPWGGSLGLAGTGAHERSLGPGSATWRRVGMTAGILRHQAWGRVSLDEDVAVVPAWLFIQGNHYTQARSTQTWDFGAGATVRLGLTLGRLTPWVQAGFTAWLRGQAIEVTGISQQQMLPGIEALVGAGIAVAWDRWSVTEAGQQTLK